MDGANARDPRATLRACAGAWQGVARTLRRPPGHERVEAAAGVRVAVRAGENSQAF